MTDNTSPQKDSPAPAPHSWTGLALGLAGLTVFTAAATFLLVQFLQHRPIDFTVATQRAADSLDELFASNRVPEDMMVVEGPQLHSSDTARWNVYNYDVQLPSRLSVSGVTQLIESRMMKVDEAFVVSAGNSTNDALTLAYGEIPFATIKLRASPIQQSAPPENHDDTSPRPEQTVADASGFDLDFASSMPVALMEVEPQEIKSETMPEAEPETPVADEAMIIQAPNEVINEEMPDPVTVAAVRPWVPPHSSAPREISVPKEAFDKKPKHRLAIIIDDGGYGGEATEAILALSPKLTLAILPYTPYGAETAQRAQELGFEIMLHMPMEHNDANSKSHEGVLTVDMDAEMIREYTQAALDQIPGVSGVNNHMGSRFTSDPKAMANFIDVIRGKNLFFVDSRTTADTRAHEMAKAFGVPSTERNVFLDNENDETVIHNAFNEAVETTKKKGSAVAIGHFRPLTAAVLASLLPTLESEGVELVHASEIVQ